MTFVFSTEGTGFRYLSNQAIRMSLPGVVDPWGAARLFSLSSSPTEPGLLAITAKISDTPFKHALSQLRPGQLAEVYGPIGRFLLDLDRPSVFVAGGIGITPFRGMARFAVDSRSPIERRLLYSARVPEELVFRAELDALSRAAPQFVPTYTVTRPTESSAPWAGRIGRIDEAWIREAAAGLDRPKFYVAGLPDMVQQTVATLTGPMGIPREDLVVEVFRGY